jgi:hypothetical protein
MLMLHRMLILHGVDVAVESRHPFQPPENWNTAPGNVLARREAMTTTRLYCVALAVAWAGGGCLAVGETDGLDPADIGIARAADREPGQKRPHSNTDLMNGRTMNGRTMNTLALNGGTLNGRTMNGRTMNGRTMNTNDLAMVDMGTPSANLNECEPPVSGMTRNCGFASAGVGVCTPGTTVQVGTGCGLGTASGDTVMRICAGTATCAHAQKLAENNNCSSSSTASKVQFTCPSSGLYTVMVGPNYSAASVSFQVAASAGTFPRVLHGAALVGAVFRDGEDDASSTIKVRVDKYVQPVTTHATLNRCSGLSPFLPSRDCNWGLEGVTTCTPGTLVRVGCHNDAGGSALVRTCNGSSPCTYAASRLSTTLDCRFLGTPATFACPSSGLVTVMVSGPAYAFYRAEVAAGNAWERRWINQADPEIGLYALQASVKAAGVWGAWQPPCAGGALAAAVGATWDLASGARTTPPAGFTFACMNGAIGKCLAMGYKLWKGPTYDVLHQACTRMIRNDYMGNGWSWTYDGTPIEVEDVAGIQTLGANRPSTYTFEAAWVAGGAECVDRYRWEYDEVAGQLCTDNLEDGPWSEVCAVGYLPDGAGVYAFPPRVDPNGTYTWAPDTWLMWSASNFNNRAPTFCSDLVTPWQPDPIDPIH